MSVGAPPTVFPVFIGLQGFREALCIRAQPQNQTGITNNRAQQQAMLWVSSFYATRICERPDCSSVPLLGETDGGGVQTLEGLTGQGIDFNFFFAGSLYAI